VVALVILRLGVDAAGQVQQLDLAEVDRMTLALQGDIALIEQLAVLLDEWIETIDDLAADLRHFIRQHSPFTLCRICESPNTTVSTRTH